MNSKSAVTEIPQAKQKRANGKGIAPLRQAQSFNSTDEFGKKAGDFALFQGGCETLLAALPEELSLAKIPSARERAQA
jgi:hypothetical protein